MSASPFRSHLLQQWARTNQKRPPIAAAPWLKPSSASGRSDNNNLDADDSTMNHHHGGARRRNHHHTKGNSSSSNGPPSLSTIDSNSNANSLASSWSESHHHRRHKPSPTSGKQASILMTREFSSLTSLPSSSGSPSASSSSKGSNISDTSNSSALASSIAFSTCASNDASAEEDDYDEVAEFLQPPLEAIPMQSLMLTRRTETEQSVFSKKNSKTLEELSLMSAVDRAVKCAQMAPNHKRTEPFSFSRFGFGSQTAHELAEIAYNVTLTDTQNEPNAEGKRWRWLHIPVFLVASVHNNQSPIEISDSTDYDPLPFHPPQTERQLEDVSIVLCLSISYHFFVANNTVPIPFF